ncbi:MAG: hypothetical protein FJW23_07000 [Acidimicrobiia bacterium]|nr:hypothetical protein [Acidimicrobiia bacterium]
MQNDAATRPRRAVTCRVAALTAILAAVPVAAALSANGAPEPSAEAAAQAAPSTAAPYVPKRLPDGQPDMQGTYVPNWPTSVPIERWTDEERKAYAGLLVEMRGGQTGAGGGGGFGGERELQGNAPAGTIMIVDPPDGRIPYQPWAEAKRRYLREHLYDREEYISTRTRCFPAGTRSMNMGSNYNGWLIVQAPGVVQIIEEWHHTVRTIYLDGRPHPGPAIQRWMGDSRGRWEGNTLVVDARNFTDKTWIVGEIDGEGPSNSSFHSPALRVQERFTLVDGDQIDYEATYEDPNVFTRPWTLRRKIWKRAPADYELFEYACHEGNIGWENIKKGLMK